MYKVTDDEIEDILEMAGYAIGYWAEAAHIDSRARTYSVKLEEDASMTGTTVPFDYIMHIARRIAKGEHEMNDEVRGMFVKWYEALEADDEDSSFAGEHIDSTAADVLVQIALYDEIVYG